jgi:anti-anti-sigma factor
MDYVVYRPLGSPDVALVDVAVDLRGRASEAFRKLVRHLDRQGVKWIVMDCSRSKSMDSLAIGVLLMAFRLCEQKGGSVLLLRPAPDLVTLFEAMNIDQFFQVFAHRDAVVTFLKEQGVRISNVVE